MRDGKAEEALALYRQTLLTSPNSVPANVAAGSVLDLMGKGEEARKYFTKAIDVADTPEGKASAKRAMAMSYAFEGNCKKTIEYEQQVFDFHGSVKNFFQQGEIADEAARVCIDSGDLDAAYKWYQIGHDTGLKEPDIKPARQDLWNFRWEHAQARIAARRGDQAEAQKHVAAAKAILGYMVYLSDATGTGAAGSYQVNSDGTGRWYFAAAEYMRLEIGGPPIVASGPWTSILIFEWTGGGTDGLCNDCGSGTAILQQ